MLVALLGGGIDCSLSVIMKPTTKEGDTAHQEHASDLRRESSWY